MSDQLILNLSALIALLPLSLYLRNGLTSASGVFWLLVVVAIAGPVLLLIIGTRDGWHTDLSTSIWITIAASMVVYFISSLSMRESAKLGVIFAPYMLVLGVFAVIWTSIVSHTPSVRGDDLTGWFGLHIFVSVTTYALVTLAAVAALAAALQERSLKTKQQTKWGVGLPALSDCDQLVVRLLIMGEFVLALGLLSGIGLNYSETQSFVDFDHKSILAVTAFIVIAGLLIAHFKTGLRGRKAARVVLFVYLLLTLSYPGVKIVTDIILAR